MRTPASKQEQEHVCHHSQRALQKRMLFASQSKMSVSFIFKRQKSQQRDPGVCPCVGLVWRRADGRTAAASPSDTHSHSHIYGTLCDKAFCHITVNRTNLTCLHADPIQRSSYVPLKFFHCVRNETKVLSLVGFVTGAGGCEAPIDS